MLVDVTATDPRNDWSYLAEGGASIVFSYVGPSHPTYNGTVLRLRKSLRHQNPSSTLCDTSLVVEVDDPSIAFQETVTSRLIPKAHLPLFQAARVNHHWLKELEGVADVRRPIKRVANESINLYRSRAVLATNLVGGSGWAVEIKPKWGFLPSPKYLSSKTRQLKMQHCRFCMQTHFKAMNQYSIATNYCPLDLFSGDETRVRRALHNLWEAWAGSQGKVNNLRLFNEGDVVDPGDAHSLSCLATKLHGSNQSITLLDPLPSFVDAVVPLILGNPLFSKLAHLQRTLDSLDIEGLSQAWAQFHPGAPLGQGEAEPTLDEWDAFTQTYLSGGEETLRYNILAYLLSATFKDCSVILQLDNTGEAEDTVTVIDLDPKNISRLSKWEMLDREITKNFENVADKRALCIDAHV